MDVFEDVLIVCKNNSIIEPIDILFLGFLSYCETHMLRDNITDRNKYILFL